MEVSSMQLARDITRDADTSSRSASIGHGSGDLRSPVVHGGDGAGGRPAGSSGAAVVGVADAEILDEAGERHDGSVQLRVRSLEIKV